MVNDCVQLLIPVINEVFKKHYAMNIVMNTPGGTVNFDIPIMKVSKYSLSEIFEKDLYFLLPFYIFNLENIAAKHKNIQKEVKEIMGGRILLRIFRLRI